MASEENRTRKISTCKFVDPDDPDERNDILFNPPKTIGEWKASITRCMELVEERMDDIERRIRSAPPARHPVVLDDIPKREPKVGSDEESS